MDDYLYSVRMRAASRGSHLGGAERLVPEEDWLPALHLLSRRARSYPGVDEVHLVSELVAREGLHYCKALSVRMLPAAPPAQARRQVAALLNGLGVGASAVEKALHLLDAGPAPGGKVMRGAVIMNSRTGERLEPDMARGVRASRMDFTNRCRNKLINWLEEQDLTNSRLLEALAVATKVIWSGALAELCWSDNPDYVAGYVSGASCGYCRFHQLKQPGIPIGGRVFFLQDPEQLSQFIHTLETIPLLIQEVEL